MRCWIRFLSVVVQSLNHVWLFATPWTAVRQASLTTTISWSLLKLMSTESVMPPNHLVLCCHLILLLSVFPSIRVFSNKLALCNRWPNWISAPASVLPMNIQDWLPLGWTDWISLESKGLSRVFSRRTSQLKSINFQCSTSFIVLLSHPYMTTRKTIALTRQNFVGKVMSMLFNMLSRLVVTFVPRSKCLLISWLQSPSAVIFEHKKKLCHCFHCFLIYLSWNDGIRCHDLSFLNVEF